MSWRSVGKSVTKNCACSSISNPQLSTGGVKWGVEKTPKCTRPNWILALGFHPRPYQPYASFGLVREKNVIYSPYLSCLGRSALKGSNIVGFGPWPFCRTEVFMILMLVIYFSTLQGSLKVLVSFIAKRQLKIGHFAWSLRFQSSRTCGVNCNVTMGNQ